MKQLPKLRPCIWDGAVVLIVVLLALGSGFAVHGRSEEGQSLEAVISVDGQEQQRFCLEGLEPTTYEVTSGKYTLEIALTSTAVWVEHSDCPTQDCVHTGKISRVGQSIVCLPARVVIELQGSNQSSDVDLITG